MSRNTPLDENRRTCDECGRSISGKTAKGLGCPFCGVTLHD